MDSDNPDNKFPGKTGSPGGLPENLNHGPGPQSFRLPRFSLFSRKPRLRQEVIELAPPRDSDDPSTSSNVNYARENNNPPCGVDFSPDTVEMAHRSASLPHGNSGSFDMSGGEDENEGVLDTHIAVLYDKYINMKESISNKIRDKIMAFMRDDLDNDPSDEEMDVEGGLAPLRTDSTYDGLVLITTILLGFVFKSPLMWIVGSFLFLIYGNFKRKIVKWGLINVFLAIVSIVYGAQSWGFTDPEVFTIKPGGRSILLSRMKHIKLEPGILSYDGKDAVILTIEGNKNLKWSIIHNDTEHKLNHGNFSNELLVDSKLIPASTDMIRLNHEIMVKGLVQVSVKFKTTQPTPAQSYELPKSHYYPLYHKPSNKPYEVSFECHPVDPGSHEIENTGGTFYHIDFEEGIKDSNGKKKNLKGIRGAKYNPYRQNEFEDEELDDMESELNSDNLPVEAYEEEAAPEKPPIKADSDKMGGEKKYIGVDATESDVFVTRLFQVSKLSKCSLVHIPKTGTDVVSVYIKRLQ